MHISVVTATRQRLSSLGQCLRMFQSQCRGELHCEHIVVADGPDRRAMELAKSAGARGFELPVTRGHAGAFAKDMGVREARGEYVCFWDDDNWYEPHALTTLFAAVQGADIGVARVRHHLRKALGQVMIPRSWNGTPRAGDIDTMCVIVRTELARKELWGDADNSPGTDIRWLRKLQAHEPVIRYVPVTIGDHL